MDAEDQCGACGERNPADTAFCLFCGAYLGWNEPGRGPAHATGSTHAPVTGTPVGGGAPPAGAATPQPTPEPTPEPVRDPSPTPPGTACPHCRQPNTAERRFCSRCGYPLVAAPSPASSTTPPPPPRGWWARWTDPEGRRAKREYRRSLPALYRWRRVLVGVGVVAVVAVVLGLTGNNPVAYVRDRWHSLTVGLTPIADVTAAARPPGSVAASYNISQLPGERRDAWATPWSAAPSSSRECGATPPNAGRIVLTWDRPTRILGLDVWAGVAVDKQRLNQFRPRRLDVTYETDTGPTCVERTLKDTADRQRLSLDTKTPVTSVVLSVGDVFGTRATPPQNLVAIGGVEVLHRP
ncbi:MAG: zinc ribbon domain-containing protein [Nocardioides sp.]